MKKIIAILLVIAMAFCGLTACGNELDDGTAPEMNNDGLKVNKVIDSSGPINPLTGEEVGDDYDTSLRPYCVMINNVPKARYGLNVSEASIIYEISVEGATRLMAIFDTLGDFDIGYVRSARTYFASVCKSYDGIYVHWGRSEDTQENVVTYVRNNNIPDMDALDGDYTGYRSQTRINEGRNVEHTAYLNGKNVMEQAEKLGYTAHDSAYDNTYGLIFSPEAVSQCENSAADFTVSYGTGNFASNFIYSEADGVYKLSMNEGGSSFYEYKDENGTLLTFANIIVLNVPLSQTGDYKGHVAMDMTGEGTGYFCTGGKYVEIKWSRDSLEDSFHYTLADGTPLALGVGKTFVSVADLDDLGGVSWNK